jgi:hypothetical protein
MTADDEFIMQLNNIITRYKNILAQEFGRKNKSSEQESSDTGLSDAGFSQDS